MKTDLKAITDQDRPFQFVKFLSWSFFVLILASSLAMGFVISNYGEKVLLSKQKQFARLLAANINHQVYRRFILPSILGYGSVNLSNAEQFERLDQLIRSTVHGFHTLEVRIYDLDSKISYSTIKDFQDREDLGSESVTSAIQDKGADYVIENRLPPFLGLFIFHPSAGSVVLKTVTPLRAEENLADEENPVIGVLEFTQDITGDYETVLTFQRIIIFTSLLSAIGLFYVMRLIIRRADRVNLERIHERERLERELHQQEKLAGMGRMVAGVAHEIRNPLGIIRSSSELLMKKAQKDNSRDALILKAIHDESKRLSRTVGDFLDYARPKTPRMDLVDASAVLDQVAFFLENECGKNGVRIEKNYESGLMVRGDKDLLYRALYNLVSNGMQAMGGKGGLIRMSAQRDGDKVRMTVDDTGTGFSAQDMERVLDPFFTTKDTGTGLGLAIVSNIVESHGGRLNLSNNEQGGARAELLVPSASPDSHQAEIRMSCHVLILDDEQNYLLILEALLSDEGYKVTALNDPELGLAYLEDSEVDVLITDMKMPKLTGRDVLEHVKRNYSHIPVLIMTAFGSIEAAVEAMKVGAFDYITKPFANEEMLLSVSKAAQFARTQRENRLLRRQLEERFGLDRIVARGRAMKDVLEMVGKAGPSKSTVLITGESGTGKELIARAIHQASPRKDGSFISVNCMALNPGVLESELFGHEKGSFTGAVARRRGRFEMADKGTLFLDEIGELTQDLQVKLLRVLQERTFERVGGTDPIEVDIRIVTATNKDLERAVADGDFREDLFYRLNVVRIDLPPLRERREDIPVLASHFLHRFATENEKTVTGFDAGAMDYLTAYEWPGNVRQLENVVERCVVLAHEGEIGVEDLPPEIKDEESQFKSAVDLLPTKLNLAETMDKIEGALVRRALVRSDFVQVKAAEMLGVSKSNLQYKLKKFKITGH